MYFFNGHLILVKGAGVWQHFKMNSCIFLQLYSRRQWQDMLLSQICLNPDLDRSPFEMSLCAHSILDLPAKTLSVLPIYDVDLGLRGPAHFKLTTKPFVTDGNSIMTWRWFQASGHWGNSPILLQIFWTILLVEQVLFIVGRDFLCPYSVFIFIRSSMHCFYISGKEKKLALLLHQELEI